MLNRHVAGFSLIELMVTVSILAILLVAAVPGIGAWIANARVRSVAEALQNGLRTAQTEALRRNRQVAFALTDAPPALGAKPAANGVNWFAQALPLVASEEVDASYFVQGSALARQGGVSVTGPAVLCFGSVGRQATNASTGLGANCTSAAAAYRVSREGSDRPLEVRVDQGGRVRMCDPARTLSSGQPDGC